MTGDVFTILQSVFPPLKISNSNAMAFFLRMTRSFIFTSSSSILQEFSSNLENKALTHRLIKNHSDFLFTEAEAASKAGCRVIISIRPGNVLLTEEEKSKFDCIESFSQLSAT